MTTTGFPFSSGDILTAAEVNGFVTFTPSTQTADYTPVLNDQYQTLVVMNKATAVNFNIPTDASVAYPIGTTITILNINAGLVTIKAVSSGTTTVNSAAATSAQPTLAQWKSCAAIKLSANNWVVVGAVA